LSLCKYKLWDKQTEMGLDIRWKQRFINYEKALLQLTRFIEKEDLDMPYLIDLSKF